MVFLVVVAVWVTAIRQALPVAHLHVHPTQLVMVRQLQERLQPMNIHLIMAKVALFATLVMLQTQPDLVKLVMYTRTGLAIIAMGIGPTLEAVLAMEYQKCQVAPTVILYSITT